jgi:hypothetical protein
VKCEHCGCEFAYKLTRSAEGTGSDVLWLNEQGAVRKAQSNAQNSLQQKMSEIDAIHCPDCGKYQKSMVSMLISNKRRTGSGIGCSLLLVLVLIEEIIAYNGGYDYIYLPIILFTLVVVPIVWKAIKYDPATSIGEYPRYYSDNYPVLRRSEIEQLAAQIKETTVDDI